MSNLNNLQRKIFEKLFNMKSGYVLDFSDSEFQEFIKNSVDIDIYDDKYNYASGSKANRLRCFWNEESDQIVYRLLNELLEYYEHVYEFHEEKNPNLLNKAKKLLVSPNIHSMETDFNNEENFLKQEFEDIDIFSLGLESNLNPIIQGRINEIKICLKNNAPLSSIFLIGSTLEGILLNFALLNKNEYIEADSAPKYKGKVKEVHKWTLNNLIEISYELGYLKKDVEKFSQHLREFRNYIHPYKQMSSKFNPNKHTAKICWQVLNAIIYQLPKR
jgi:hypothetical protein